MTHHKSKFSSWGLKQKQHNRVCVCVLYVCLLNRARITTKWSQSEQSAGHKKDQYLTFIDMNLTRQTVCTLSIQQARPYN